MFPQIHTFLADKNYTKKIIFIMHDFTKLSTF